MKYKRIFLVILGVLLLLYIGLANILVSAALVPSFMERLEAFSRITQESVDALVHTDRKSIQRKKAISGSSFSTAIQAGKRLCTPLLCGTARGDTM